MHVAFCQIVTMLATVYLVTSTFPRPKGSKKLAIEGKVLYNTVDTLLEHCKRTRDTEGAMLIVAFGKHLYDTDDTTL